MSGIVFSLARAHETNSISNPDAEQAAVLKLMVADLYVFVHSRTSRFLISRGLFQIV